ncbi:MAG TPA: hypothetical protein VGK05_04825 [Acidimicrobiia bacterium]
MTTLRSVNDGRRSSATIIHQYEPRAIAVATKPTIAATDCPTTTTALVASAQTPSATRAVGNRLTRVTVATTRVPPAASGSADENDGADA